MSSRSGTQLNKYRDRIIFKFTGDFMVYFTAHPVPQTIHHRNLWSPTNREDRTLHIHRCEDLKSYIELNTSWLEFRGFIINLGINNNNNNSNNNNKLRDLSPQSELYRPNYRCLSAKLVPTFADRECRVVSATLPDGHCLGLFCIYNFFSQ
jgi:hypothetical protein